MRRTMVLALAISLGLVPTLLTSHADVPDQRCLLRSPGDPVDCPDDVVGTVRLMGAETPIVSAHVYDGHAQTYSGPDGSYRLRSQTWGTFAVAASAPGCITQQKIVQASPTNYVTGPTRLDFELDCGSTAGQSV